MHSYDSDEEYFARRDAYEEEGWAELEEQEIAMAILFLMERNITPDEYAIRCNYLSRDDRPPF